MDTISVSQALQIAGRAGRYGTEYEKVNKRFKKYQKHYSLCIYYFLNFFCNFKTLYTI